MMLALVQVAAVLAVTLACGWLARRCGQARVIGELIGGIIVGPSVFGRLAPRIWAQLFNETSLLTFDLLSTIGLILFLFLIGMEVDFDQLQKERRTASIVCAASTICPFGMGALLAPALRARFASNAPEVPFIIFVGIAVSVTAFPVLARILDEQSLNGTALATTAIFCAAVSDVTSWLLLAFGLALLGGHGGPSLLSLRLIALLTYIVIMLGVLRPFVRWAARRRQGAGISIELLSMTIVGVLLSAAATDFIGVHPLFGAFLAGTCFPKIPSWQVAARSSIEVLVSVLLLPLFFAVVGIRTRLDLIGGGTTWLWVAIILGTAIAGKMGAAALAARWTGHSWRYATALGALLNTRGLVELIILKIALSAGILSPQLFTIFVIMAVLTTVMTMPVLRFVGIAGARREQFFRVSTANVPKNQNLVA